jgi:hypothetical protein
VADFIFNIAKGRGVEFYNRVKSNDPANSAFIVVPVNVAAVTDATIKDFDTLSAILGGGVSELTAGGWSRKTLTDVELTALPAPDDTNDRYDVGAGIAALVWTAVAASNNSTDLILCYDSDTTAGNDTNLIPVAQYDFAITTDGSDVQASVNTAGLIRAA